MVANPLPFHPFSLLAAALLAAGSPVFAAEGSPPVAVQSTVVLYDGKTVNDLSKFYVWLGPKGHEDANRVFTVVGQVDGAPAIRVSGEDWGGLVTPEAYSRYKLVLEYRWGNVTSGKRMIMARNSGILLHCQGEDGNFEPNFASPWCESIEYDIMEGRTGVAVLVPGYRARGSTDRLRPRATMTARADSFYWDPQGSPREFQAGQKKFHWFAEDPAWQDVLGFRGKNDLEKPLGEWNLVEAIVDGGHLTYFLNGVKTMELSECSLTSGRLLFQSEGAEIYFRRIELQPIGH